MKHIALITSQPQRSGNASIPDGAITGNGDLAVILGNSPDGLRIFLSKTDVWYAVEYERQGGLRPVGYLDFPVPKAMYDNYRVEQDMDASGCRLRQSGFLRRHLAISAAVSYNKVEGWFLYRKDDNP